MLYNGMQQVQANGEGECRRRGYGWRLSMRYQFLYKFINKSSHPQVEDGNNGMGVE